MIYKYKLFNITIYLWKSIHRREGIFKMLLCVRRHLSKTIQQFSAFEGTSSAILCEGRVSPRRVYIIAKFILSICVSFCAAARPKESSPRLLAWSYNDIPDANREKHQQKYKAARLWIYLHKLGIWLISFKHWKIISLRALSQRKKRI